MHDISVSSLIGMIRGGARQDEAFAELARRYAPLITKRVSSFFSNDTDIAEATQEAHIALHSAAVSYDVAREDEVTFGLYASVCIANRLKSLIREKNRRSEQCESLDGDRLFVVSDLEKRLAGRELCLRIMAIAKDVLSDYEYKVFTLSLDGLKTREIAERLSKGAKSVDNAKARLTRTLKMNKEICEALVGII